MTARGHRTPVQVVTGFPGQGAHELMAGWLEDKPAGQRWAVIVNGLAGLGALERFASADESQVEVLQVSGCGCCIAGPALSTTLSRLLKRGPWDLVILDASGQAHAATLVERLRSIGPAAQFAVLPPLLAADITKASAYIDEQHAAHAMAMAWLELSPGRVLGAPGTLTSERPDSLPSFRDPMNRLAARSGLPHRVWQTATGHVPLGELRAQLADVLDLAGQAGARRWEPTQVFDRPRLQCALQSLAEQLAALARPGVRANGVFRTERAWYAWSWRADRLDWQESGWRMDSRIQVLVPDTLAPTCVEKGLLALDDALKVD